MSNYINTEPTTELLNTVSLSVPDFDIELLQKKVTLKYVEEDSKNFTGKYYRSVLFKWLSYPILYDIYTLFTEIRYSYLYVLSFQEIKKEQKSESHVFFIDWKIKYYSENAIFRYYSLWEYTGRFFNTYFNLKLDQGKKNITKEQRFYFSRNVLKIIIKKYNHHLLVKLFELWGKNHDLLDYRSKKTHFDNPNLSNINSFTFNKSFLERKTKHSLVRKEGIKIDEFIEKCNRIFNVSLEVVNILFKFYDIGHSQVEKLEKEINVSNIIKPNISEVAKYSSSIITKKNKSQSL